MHCSNMRAVLSREYFFGGGVQAMSPAEVTSRFGLAPVQRIDLGATDIPQEVFLDFLYSIRFAHAVF